MTAFALDGGRTRTKNRRRSRARLSIAAEANVL
jgi:hypothetical protein